MNPFRIYQNDTHNSNQNQGFQEIINQQIMLSFFCIPQNNHHKHQYSKCYIEIEIQKTNISVINQYEDGNPREKRK
jgi:hypothetical protein